MVLFGSGVVLFWFLVFIFLVACLLSFFTVSTAQVAIVTRFGKFLRVAEAGLNWKWPFIDRVAGRMSLRVNQITLTMETKTKDNVFVTIPISVQNRVRPEKVFDAYYKLSDPVQQIQAYVEQVILGHVPGMTLDEVFASQSGIAAAVKLELDADMAGFGYEIVNVLVTDIVPDAKVKSAMNDINAAQREQVAANARGEAEKILVVKKGRSRGAKQGAARSGHCQSAQGDHRGPARLDRAISEDRRRLDHGSHAAGLGHAIFRYHQIDRRIGQDQYAVPVALPGRGARHFRPDPAIDAGGGPGEELK